MKVIAAIWADLQLTPLGTRARLTEEIAGQPVLRRTVERVSRAQRIEEVHVLCPEPLYEQCGRLLADTGARVHHYDGTWPPYCALVRAARKWSLSSWRGGVGYTTAFDEYTHTPILSGLLKQVAADAVLCVPPAAPLFDPGLADRMVEEREAAGEEVRLTFTQAPPGIAGILLDTDVVHELVAKNIPPGWIFAYKPDNPAKDLIFQPCHCEIPAPLRYAAGRLVADTRRSFERVSAILADHPDPDAERIGQWLLANEQNIIEPLPCEVEIELTTNDPYPDALLRPRGHRLARTGVIDPAIVERVAQELCAYDDSLMVLGGFGDPLRHPQFEDILQRIPRPAPGKPGVFGLALQTSAVDLTPELARRMIDVGLDVLVVNFDAWTPELYDRLQAPGGEASGKLDSAIARLEQLAQMRQERRLVAPIVVPQMTKAKQNVHELDEFHDGWIKRWGAVQVTGASHYAGQFPDHRVINMAPAAREGCRRLRSRCLVLADGSVTCCDQDYQGKYVLGSLHESSLAEIWHGADFERLRAVHRSGNFEVNPLCVACNEWQRP